ncbi:hypothetical protein C8R45DRAFT_1029413 [Mycena sanguinolenta]|nr:hypothetical protein C8R45DRAFT_1029413 [Mycena sanguinolenta]
MNIKRLTCWVFGALAYQHGTRLALLMYIRLASCWQDKDSVAVLALIRSRLALFPELQGLPAAMAKKVTDVLKGA